VEVIFLDISRGYRKENSIYIYRYLDFEEHKGKRLIKELWCIIIRGED